MPIVFATTVTDRRCEVPLRHPTWRPIHLAAPPSWPFTWLQLSTKIQFPQFLLSQWPQTKQPPTPVLLQLDLQPKHSPMFDLPDPASHGPPPSSLHFLSGHVTTTCLPTSWPAASQPFHNRTPPVQGQLVLYHTNHQPPEQSELFPKSILRQSVR